MPLYEFEPKLRRCRVGPATLDPAIREQ
jgi:hypothetical protein